MIDQTSPDVRQPRQTARPRWSRWHVRLAWVAAVPLLLWTATGLFMTSFPIERVRGEGVVREPPRLTASDLAAVDLPSMLPPGTHALALRQRAGRPLWVASGPAGDVALDPATGAVLPAISVADARAIALDARTDRSVPIRSISFTHADKPPVALRKPRATWHVRFVDGVHLFIDYRNGDILATRTRLWRWYDLAWGLHILDPIEREDTHHPLLTLAAIAALATTIAGIVLLGWRRR